MIFKSRSARVDCERGELVGVFKPAHLRVSVFHGCCTQCLAYVFADQFSGFCLSRRIAPLALACAPLLVDDIFIDSLEFLLHHWHPRGMKRITPATPFRVVTKAGQSELTTSSESPEQALAVTPAQDLANMAASSSAAPTALARTGQRGRTSAYRTREWFTTESKSVFSPTCPTQYTAQHSQFNRPPTCWRI